MNFFLIIQFFCRTTLTWFMKHVSPRCSNTFVVFDTPGITHCIAHPHLTNISDIILLLGPKLWVASLSGRHLWKWPGRADPQPGHGRDPSPHPTWCPETSPQGLRQIRYFFLLFAQTENKFLSSFSSLLTPPPRPSHHHKKFQLTASLPALQSQPQLWNLHSSFSF